MSEEQKKKMEGLDIGASIMGGVPVYKDKGDVGRPVVNAAGEIIGHTVKETEPTIQDAGDILHAGMKGESDKLKARVAILMDEAAVIADAISKIPLPDLKRFETRLDGDAKRAELDLELELKNKAIDQELARLSEAPEHVQWRHAVGRHRMAIKARADGKG